MNYESAIKYINEIPKFTKKNKLENTRSFLKMLNVQQDKMKIIHVAGTNGKGTICAIIANVLQNCGKTTGLFTSPHLVQINERFCINGENVDNEDFLEAFLTVKSVTDRAVEMGLPHPSYFEFLFIMAMWIFNKKKVEYIVLETGLGGRLDATNSIDKPILTVISSVGMDHMEYLGNTIEDIAGEKAGIIKENILVVFWGENADVSNVIEKTAVSKNAPFIKTTSKNYKITKKTDKSVAFSSLCEYYLNDTFSVPFIAEYQVQNAAVALNAISCIPEIRDKKDEITQGFNTVRWEGRMENVSDGIILDGAHNGPGIDEFIKTFNEYKCEGNKLLLFSVVKDKDYAYMVESLAKTEAEKVFVTEINSERGLEAESIYNLFKEKGCKAQVQVISDVKSALEAAISEKGEQDVLFCAGSLYLIGEIKKIIQK